MLSAIEQSENFSIEDRQLATSILLPKSYEEDLKVINSQRYYSDASIKQDINKSDEIYRSEGVVGSSVDLFLDFAVTPVFPEATNKKGLDAALNHFNSKINLTLENEAHGIDHLFRQFALEYFVKGNVFLYTTWSKTEVPGTSKSFELPMEIVCLDPNAISMRPGKLIGHKEIMYSSRATMDLPKTGGKYLLSNKYLTHIKRRGRSYENWGLPYLTRCFNAIDKLRRLRAMDRAVMAGVTNLARIFLVGTEEHPASPSRIAAFRNILRNPGASLQAVWGHDLAKLDLGTDATILGQEKRYADVFEELIRALGLPYGVYGSGTPLKFENYLIIIQRLNECRALFKTYINKIYGQICEINNIDDVSPTLVLNPITISDPEMQKRFVVDLYDRGILDLENTINSSGWNFRDVLNKKKLHKEDEETFTPPINPFSANAKPASNQSGSRPNGPTKYDK